jgi:L-ascorbate metabolism protein UlaG (beta-lactamase superfamily)
MQFAFFHLRHATSILTVDNKVILIDPMFSEKGVLPPVILSPNKQKNPLTNLPISVEELIKNIDYLLITHLHFDHFDKKAIEILPKNIPVICSKYDFKKLTGLGFSSVHFIENDSDIDGINISCFPAVHGKGLLKPLMGEGSSYLLIHKGFKIFLTGDCLWTELLKNRIVAIKPDVIIANAGAARFKIGKPITMSINDILEMAKLLNESKIVVVHLDALNHCSQNRDFCKEQSLNHDNIYFPNDGERVNLI